MSGSTGFRLGTRVFYTLTLSPSSLLYPELFILLVCRLSLVPGLGYPYRKMAYPTRAKLKLAVNQSDLVAANKSPELKRRKKSSHTGQWLTKLDLFYLHLMTRLSQI